jgi:ribosome-associated toxin RatA of RatAB toxin-antitoxin module
MGRLPALVLLAAVMGAVPAAANGKPDVSVTEADGLYQVTATFTVAGSLSAVRAVLTDFERIPEFMPDVEHSQVLSGEPGLVVEQRATAKFLMFSKRVHLVLEVSDTGDRISFRDRCRTSFDLYQGAWTLVPHDGGVRIRYQLAARPLFDVPGFVLKRLLKRDAGRMIARIAAEIAGRADLKQ